jgi:nitrogen fixation protein NifU and related proteins
MALYSEVVMDHFRNPRHMGKPKSYDAVGKVGNPTCGDVMHIYIKVDNGIISDIGFETMGCAAAIATSSMVTELAKGKTLKEAEAITREDVAKNLKGLPPVKMHCSNLAADGIRQAIKEYRKKI